MRSRPDLNVYLTPQRPAPGERLRARVVLSSRSETPYDSVEVTLVGKESRYERTSGDGNHSTTHYHRREVLRLAATFEGGVLAPGAWERTVTFDVPRDAPPSFKSRLASIAYELEVRVRIPWWPDRRERYTVVVQSAQLDPGPAQPQLYTTQAGDHRGDDPVLELSLEDTQLVLGGTLAGAVAVTGLGGKRLRRVEVACAAVETALVKSSAGPREADRRTWVIHEGTPQEGASLSFRLAVPDDLPVTFRSPFIRVDHVIEATAVVAFGSDIKLRVGARALRAEPTRQAATVPLLGSARHVNVWRTALEQVQNTRLPGVRDIHGDPERGLASFNVQGVGVTLAEEDGEARRRTPRQGLLGGGGPRESGPCLVAELTWPELGLDLRVAERRWTDFGQRHEALDTAFQRRFTVRAREARQVSSLLSPALRDALSVFDDAGLDDEGAVVSTRGGVYKVEGLVRFIGRVHTLGAQVAHAAGSIAPPAALADSADAWRGLAQERGARLRPGDLALVDWSLRGIPLALTHCWDGERAVASELSTRLPEGADAPAWRDALANATGAKGFIDGRRVGVTLPEVARPETLLPTADAFTVAVTALLGGDIGPYR